VPDLAEGEEYEYRVAAVTDAGVGEYSNVTAPVKAQRKKRNVHAACLLIAKFHYTDPTRTRPDTDKVCARCRVRAKFHYARRVRVGSVSGPCSGI